MATRKGPPKASAKMRTNADRSTKDALGSRKRKGDTSKSKHVGGNSRGGVKRGKDGKFR